MNTDDIIAAIEAKPTTTVLLPRLPVFSPTFRPVMRIGDWIDTPTGRVKVRGRLGQRHEALLEAIARHYMRRHIVPSEPAPIVDVLVDPATIRKALSTREGGSYSYEQLLLLLSDLRDAEIEIDVRRHPKRIIVHGSLIAHYVEYREMELSNPLPATPTRHPLLVRLGIAYTMLVGVDVPRFWHPTDFRFLTTGAAQALARWCWTHRRPPRGGWKLDTILRAITPAAMGPNTLRNRRREVRRDRAELDQLGIRISDDARVHYDGRLSRNAPLTEPSMQCADNGNAAPAQPREATADSV